MTHSDLVNAVFLTLGAAVASLITALGAYVRAEAANVIARRNKLAIVKLQNGNNQEQKGKAENGPH